MSAGRTHILSRSPFSGPSPPLMDTIRIRGARTHNLKNVSLDLPRDKLTVITGLSGSGKRSEEHTSELQSLMRISYAVFCLKKKTIITTQYNTKENSHTS